MNIQSSTNLRRPYIAAILSLLMPGLGQVYSGLLPRGLIWILLCVATSVGGLLIISSGSSWVFGCLAGLIQVGVWFAGAIDSYFCALRCKPDYELKDYNRWYVYVLLLVIGTGSLLSYAINVRNQLVQPFRIPTASMYPTIAPGDRLIALKDAFRDADPKRGDIVLFSNPNNRRQFWIKRVVALAGDRVAVKAGNLYVNGSSLSKKPIRTAQLAGTHGKIMEEVNGGAKYQIFVSDSRTAPDIDEFTVPKNECFVMGDNRNESRDSRDIGSIPIIGIVGKFEYRYWPLAGKETRWGKIESTIEK